MYTITKFPQRVNAMFSMLCLIQVMTWFDEMIESFQEKNKRFFWLGQRFDILPNQSFILDNTLKMYGIYVNESHQKN